MRQAVRNDARGAANSGNSWEALKKLPLPQDTLLLFATVIRQSWSCWTLAAESALTVIIQSWFCWTLAAKSALIITQVRNVHTVSGVPRWCHGARTRSQ